MCPFRPLKSAEKCRSGPFDAVPYQSLSNHSAHATRSDDEILVLFKYLGVFKLLDLEGYRGVVWRDIAVEVVGDRVKYPVATSVLYLTVEVAYGAPALEDST